MDFNFTQDENDFRQEIKDWLSENLSQRISNKVKKFQRLDKNDYEEFMKALSAKGWLAVNWPKNTVELVGQILKSIFLKKRL